MTKVKIKPGKPFLFGVKKREGGQDGYIFGLPGNPVSGFVCTVPAGHYFMMGDNRDASDDSRYWGFVPDDHIRGRAFFIWFNWDDIASLSFQRVGSGIR